MAIMILSCHNVIMSNQSTFILGYLLFYGYDVTGHNYVLRCCGLFAGAVICSLYFTRIIEIEHFIEDFIIYLRNFICFQQEAAGI